MAKTSDYNVFAFQRKPGYWRANVTPVVQPAATRLGTTILGFVTAEDCRSEQAAVMAAHKAIKELES
jgi:hypothetical protein